ncbi:kunitz-type protease inhibitor 2 [Boleophthalmus pectinirostris]|uniref:kunitz-type protease inhibitor 2 n=1 Tax=Boleophthalmus pectinirostris TaxID=150288 RepID=UPI00242A77DC|nr:kunitz-type protease inhibitor 2 [Boleophthalmus pectinirostris]
MKRQVERQVALVLAALCALLGCACSCEFTERVGEVPGPELLVSALERARDSDPESCRARCCQRVHCSAFVLALPQDGPAQCFLLSCDGACALKKDEDRSGQFRVFAKTDARAPGNSLHAHPLMLDRGARTKDQNNSTADVCSMPIVTGICKAMIPRWAFDAEIGVCVSFVYGGCGGNNNSFESQEECEAACAGVKGHTGKGRGKPNKMVRRAPPLQSGSSEARDSEETPETKDMSQDQYTELCAAPLVVGPCRAAFPRWFFNVSSGNCERFIYGGCKGNKNNYNSEEQCTHTCAQVKVQQSKKQIPKTEPEDDNGACSAAPDSGPCRAAFSMFYFDPQTQSCKKFIYGGCRGNENRYNNENECMEQCVSGGVSSQGRGANRNRWTAAFFLFLALAAISFLLLTALVFITLRRKRPQRTLSIRSDKQELLTDSERSSVDSLPLPESPVRP